MGGRAWHRGLETSGAQGPAALLGLSWPGWCRISGQSCLPHAGMVRTLGSGVWVPPARVQARSQGGAGANPPPSGPNRQHRGPARAQLAPSPRGPWSASPFVPEVRAPPGGWTCSWCTSQSPTALAPPLAFLLPQTPLSLLSLSSLLPFPPFLMETGETDAQNPRTGHQVGRGRRS